MDSSIVTLLVVLVGIMIAFKLLKGVIKIGVIVLLIAFAGYWLLGVAS